jgi:protein gp37
LTQQPTETIIPTRPAAAPRSVRHQIGITAGFGSEQVAGFSSECMAGFVGIRIRVSAENQEYFDQRWPFLHDINAIRFISYEPAVGPLTLGDARPDWVICGGESGRVTRMMNPAWARALRDECASKGVAFFMKQMTGGERVPIPADLLVRQFS